MQEEYKYLAVGLLVLFSFLPITIQAIRKRSENPPPLAARDRKLYRLWRSDPDAYNRQYGDLDRQYLEKQSKK